VNHYYFYIDDADFGPLFLKVCSYAPWGTKLCLNGHALLLALTLFQYLIDGFRNHDLRQQVADLLGVTLADYTPHQMTYDLRRLRLKGLIYRPPKTNRYFVTPYGWKVARLFSRLEARVFRPAMAMFTANDAVLSFPLRQALDRVDTQLDLLIYEAFPLPKAS
jgi:predicted MarR family transcription regulator